jgi:hypothetical protein
MSRKFRLAVIAIVVTAAVPAGIAYGASKGGFYGGVTKQAWPVIVQVASNGKSIKHTVIGLSLTCTSGRSVANSDGYKNLTLSKTGKFSAKFGPDTIDNKDGTHTVSSGSISGKLSGNKVSGKWQLVTIDKDAAGTTTTDTCDSGKVSFSATQ